MIDTTIAKEKKEFGWGLHRDRSQGIPGAKLVEYDDEPHGLFITAKDRLNEGPAGVFGVGADDGKKAACSGLFYCGG